MKPAARTARRGRLAAAALAVALACGPTPSPAHAAEELAAERQRAVLREALNTFDEAVSMARDDPQQAERLYRRSAAAFETLVEAGIRSAALEYNLGNAYFRLGQLGRAICHYRRAQRLAPGDAAIAANLDYARNRVEPYIAPSGRRQLVSRLMFWTGYTALRTRFWLAALLSAGGWLALIVRLRWRSRPLLVIACVAIALAAANAASVAWELRDEARRPPAVVIAGGHMLRLGAGPGYDPALTQPLGEGTELRILSERGGWVEVLLPNDKSGWLPAEAIERL